MARNISFRTVYYNGIEITYRLERKHVKNLNMRVKYDGTVSVSANHTVPNSYIDKFVEYKGQFILNALQKFSSIRASESATIEYNDNDTIYLFGQALRLKLFKSEQSHVNHDQKFIYLYVTDTNDLNEKKHVYEDFTDSQCLLIFQELINNIYPIFRNFGIEMPSLRIKSMKSRWGTCIVDRKIITLNKKLIEYPKKCIEYVIMHEFCHFIHANHSKQFYDLLSQLMPDWEERKAELNHRRLVH